MKNTSVIKSVEQEAYSVNIKDNKQRAFIIEKSQRLASAVYLITNPLSDTDPLRNRLRACVIQLTSLSLEFGHTPSPIDVFEALCMEVKTLVTLGENAGLISAMNARVLRDEYAGLATFVTKSDERLFLDTAPSLGAGAPQATRSPGDEAHAKRTNYKRHSNRREIIIDLLSKKDKITINDVSAIITECSEKTLQRELNVLVSDGVLLREGQRRWSTYKKAF